MSQREAAAFVGVARSTVANWEAGRNSPTLPQFRDLVSAYGASVYQVLHGKPYWILTSAEAAELASRAEEYDPELRSKISALLVMTGRGAT